MLLNMLIPSMFIIIVVFYSNVVAAVLLLIWESYWVESNKRYTVSQRDQDTRQHHQLGSEEKDQYSHWAYTLRIHLYSDTPIVPILRDRD